MLKIIKKNSFIKISNFLILYFTSNLISGDRGFFSFVQKKELLLKLKGEQKLLAQKILDLDQKNSLLSENIDLDYIETLIRERFLFGKNGETLYIIKKNED